MRNRLYLDTEFNGHGGRLISIALVEESGCREFYEVLPIGNLDPWVAEHVVPVLRKRELPTASVRKLFHNFIQGFSNPEIICDWHADAAHFCDMLAGPDYSTSIDFPCRITILKTPPGQPVSAVPHNALEDARALRDWHLALRESPGEPQANQRAGQEQGGE
jgi:hypothetical protein